MPDSREPSILYTDSFDRQYVSVPPEGNGTCAVCLHAYGEHSISLDGATQTCDYLEPDAGYPYDCGCLEYVPS